MFNLKTKALKYVMDFYEKQKPYHEAICRKWYYNLMMQWGNQWHTYDNNNLREEGAPRWRIRATFNKLLPLSIMQFYSILPDNPTITVNPANPNSAEDKDKSDTANQLCRALWRDKKFKKQLKKTVRWMIPCTVGYMLPLWDGRAGTKLEDGAYTGELFFESASPFEIVPDYAVDDFDEQRRFIRMKVRSIDDIEYKYGKKVKADKLDLNAVYQLKSAALASGININDTNILKDHALVYEMWELPSVKKPSGFHHICTANDELIEPEDMGLNYKISNEVKEYFLPLEAAQLVVLAGRLIGTNSVEQGSAAQCYFNKGKSEILENAKRMGRPKIIAPKGKIPDGGFVENPAQLIVEYNPDIDGEIYFQKPPEMAQYHLNNINSMPGEMEDTFGIHPASQGVLPRRATSGKAITFLVGQDDKRAIDPKEEIDNLIAGAMSKGLNIAANGYTEERMKDLIGDDEKSFRKNIKGEELRNVDITVIRDMALPKDSAGRLELALAVLEKKPTTEDIRIMFAIMAAKNFDELESILSGNSQAEEVYARMENYDMAKGIPRDPVRGENHQMHKKIHELVLKNPNTIPEARQMVIEHITKHDMAEGTEAADKNIMAAGIEAQAGGGEVGAAEGQAQPMAPGVEKI